MYCGEKVRKIRCSNEKFLAHLGGLPVAMNFLEASGFIQTSLPMDNGAGMEECIVFPKEGSLSLLRQARAKLQPVLQQEKPKVAQTPASHALQGHAPAAPPPPSANVAPLIDFSAPPPVHLSNPAAASPASSQPPSEWAAFEDGGEDVEEPTRRYVFLHRSKWRKSLRNPDALEYLSSLPGENKSRDQAADAASEGDSDVHKAGQEEQQIATIHAMFGTIQGADAALLKPALDLLIRIATAILKEPGNVKLRSIKRRGAAFQKIEVLEHVP